MNFQTEMKTKKRTAVRGVLPHPTLQTFLNMTKQEPLLLTLPIYSLMRQKNVHQIDE